jgi:DNA polymerase bacteriophage-type
MSLIEQYITAVATYAEEAELPYAIKADLARAANQIIRDSGEYYRFHHDFETYCEVSVTDVGSDVYSRHPTCEPILCAYACNDEDILQWSPLEGEAMPADLREHMEDPKAIKFAWNKPFEWAIWANCLGIKTPHEKWRDPMVMAFSLSLPGSLEQAGKVVDLPEDSQKLKDGKSLIRLFCGPQARVTKKRPERRVLPHHEPEKWERFKLYNRTDVAAERGIYKRLRAYEMPKSEWKLWHLDQKINQAGIPIDGELVKNSIAVFEDLFDDRMEKMKVITGLDNPNSNDQLLEWLQKEGYPFDDLKKGHVERAHEKLEAEIKEGNYSDPNELEAVQNVARVLEMRQETAAASPKKYYALDRAVDWENPEGPVLRNALQFAGAGRTWRWAGRIWQAQNLPRPHFTLEKGIAHHARNLARLDRSEIELIYPKPMLLLKAGIRPCAKAPPGKVFIDADLNAIENRVLGWLSGCAKILRVFELGRDPYIDFASYMYGIPYDVLYAEYKAGDKTRRTIAKPGVLGCGYMLGAGEAHYNKKTGEVEATGLLGYAWDMQIREFTLEQSKLSVDTFRREFKEVKNFWYAIERAALACVRTGRETQCNMIVFDMKGPFLRMILPSGRALHYCRPKIEVKKMPWGDMKECLTYEGLDTYKRWTRIDTHPGKLTENADQAIARDLLAHGMILADKEGIDVRLHVHDQILGLSDEDKADEELLILKQCMEDQPSWAKGLPLGSAGFTSPIFIKD